MHSKAPVTVSFNALLRSLRMSKRHKRWIGSWDKDCFLAETSYTVWFSCLYTLSAWGWNSLTDMSNWSVPRTKSLWNLDKSDKIQRGEIEKTISFVLEYTFWQPVKWSCAIIIQQHLTKSWWHRSDKIHRVPLGGYRTSSSSIEDGGVLNARHRGFW